MPPSHTVTSRKASDVERALIERQTRPDAASYGWDTVRNSWTGDQFDIVRPDPAAVSPKLESWISHETADKLFKAAKLDLADLRKKARSKDFQPVAKNATLSGGFKVASSEIVTHNIIGRLPGATHPDETIVYTGHWDHLGICAPEAKDKACLCPHCARGAGAA